MGTFGGSEDHTAIMSSEPNKIKMWRFAPTSLVETVDFPADIKFVICVSGAKAEKTKGSMSDYNDAALLAAYAALCYCVFLRKQANDNSSAQNLFLPEVALCNPTAPNLAEVVRHAKAHTHGGKNLRLYISDAIASVEVGNLKSSLEAGGGTGTITGTGTGIGTGTLIDAELISSIANHLQVEHVVTRFEQFYDESEVLVSSAIRAFQTADEQSLGRIIDASHEATVAKLKNTIPETEWLPREARRLNAIAASAFGAGYGGSCYAVVREGEAEQFMERWKQSYDREFPEPGAGNENENENNRLPRVFFVMSPCCGALKL